MKAVIIGGGIIGMCSAYYLQRSGWQVTILEKNDLTDNCSFGNAGMIVPSHFTPLASPGIISQGIRWMFDSSSPFYIKPEFSWSLIDWGIRFMSKANKNNVTYAAPFLRDLNVLSHALYKELAAVPGFDFALEEKGILMYFKSEKTRDEEAHLALKAQSLGLDAEVLNRSQVQELEPQVELDILGAVHYRCDAHLYPNNLMEQMKKFLTDQGVAINTNCPVTGMELSQESIGKIKTNRGEFEADIYLIAAGSWLPGLTKMAGVHIPLMPGKGYSVTDKHPRIRLNIPAILCEARVAVTPMNGYMRFGGTMEIAGLNDKINLKRVGGILNSVSSYFPNIRVPMPGVSEIWYGFRPCSPDGLPFIGFSRKVKNLMIAGGHSMMGLSLGPATGLLVSELANHQKTSVNTEAFNPERFS
jgi:D-amino-acid dehydrogenase